MVVMNYVNYLRPCPQRRQAEVPKTSREELVPIMYGGAGAFSPQGTIAQPHCLDSFHPFPFLGNVVEKLATWQLQRILDEVDCLDCF